MSFGSIHWHINDGGHGMCSTGGCTYYGTGLADRTERPANASKPRGPADQGFERRQPRMHAAGLRLAPDRKRPSGTKQSQPNSRTNLPSSTKRQATASQGLTSQPCTRLQWKRSRPTIRNPPASRESAKPTKSEPAENKTAGDSKASKPPISSRTGPRPQLASREALQSSPPRTRLRENQGEPRRGPESLDT